jgi:hypothetical protein
MLFKSWPDGLIQLGTSSDQNFGLVEGAVIVGIVYTSAQIAELLAKTYAVLRGKRKIILKTPKGSVTIESDASTSVADILREIESADIL